ncbi:MAG: IPT/TIG domain-containing protein [Candidatus Hydrogenedentales bacterium]
MSWRRHSLILTVAVCVFAAYSAQAQRVLALTEARNAAGQPARAYAQVVDMALGAGLPGAIALPGASVNDVAIAAVQSAAARGDVPVSAQPAAFVSVNRLVPRPGGTQWTPGAVAGLNPVTQAAWGELSADPGGTFPFVYLLRSDGDVADRLALVHRGWTDAAHHLDFYPLEGEPPAPLRDQLVSIPLPYAPEAATQLGDSPLVAVAGLTESLGLWVALYEEALEPNPVLSVVAELPQAFVNPKPVCISVTADGQWLAVAVSGRRLTGGTSAAETALLAFSATTLEPAGPPVALPGEAIPANSLLSSESTLWVVTTDAEGGFVYASRFDIRPAGLELNHQETYYDAASPVNAAAADDGVLALSMRERLVVSNPEGESIEGAFASPINAVAWAEGALFIGESGRVHVIDTTIGEPAQSAQLQTGFVTHILPLPQDWLPEDDSDGDGLSDGMEAQANTAADNPDTDGDGIPDGADPYPTTPTPRLDVPSLIVFSGAAAGQELRSFLIAPEHGGEAIWRIDHDRAAMPWLVLYPEGGTTPGRVLLGVNPELVPSQDALLQGELTISLAAVNGDPAAGSPATITLLVTPPPDALRRIGWIWPEAEPLAPLRAPQDPRRFKALADMLAAPPHYFVQEEMSGPVAAELAAFDVLVLDVAAALDQGLSRQAVLDYVAGGGSVLIMGRYLGETSATPPRWLSPAGLHLDTTQSVSGEFPCVGGDEICGPLEALRIQQGCLIRLDAQDAIIAPNAAEPNAAAFAAYSYGLGRVAVLAGPTPLQSIALNTPDYRAFAAGLFEWLARAPREVRDQDGDGLADGGEDINDNGTVDPGETDYLDPDTDGDGIPDAMEDMNRNGWLDPGETNPLLTDTDGDGINDGADESPTPDAEAPYVASVSVPNRDRVEGPSEGGTYVAVTGSNFTAESEVWFGNLPAAHTRKVDAGELLAVTPPYPNWQGGTVGVRVVNEAGQAGLLPFGYTYTARSVARIVFRSLSVIATQAGVYEGAVQIHVEAPEAAVGRGHLFIAPEPRVLVQVTALLPGEAALTAGRLVESLHIDRGLTRVMFTAGNDMAGLGHLATVRWTATLPPAVQSVLFTAVEPYVAARNGAPLAVVLESAEVNLPRTVAPAGTPGAGPSADTP